MWKYTDSPMEIYSRYKERISASKIWADFNKVLEASFRKRWGVSFYRDIAKLFPTIKKEGLRIKRFVEDSHTPREALIRNYLLEKPALLQYFYPEITLCFAEMRLIRKGVGARPDIVLAQWSHRGAPRRYLIIELKQPTEPMAKKKLLSKATNEAIVEQSRRCLYGVSQSNFFRDMPVEGVWIDTLILVGAQQFQANKEAVPIKGVRSEFTDKVSEQVSDIILGLRKMLSPAQLLTYDALRRQMMLDIIALRPSTFDKWIDRKSGWIIEMTKEFTALECFKNMRKYNPYVDEK